MFTMKQNYAGFWIPKLIAEFEVFGWNITKVYSLVWIVTHCPGVEIAFQKKTMMIKKSNKIGH